MKKALIFILSSFLGIVSGPDILMASDTVSVNELNNAGIVETVIPEPEPEPEPEYEPVYYAPSYAAPSDTLNIAGRSLRVEYSSNTNIDAGGVVKYYNARLSGGHILLYGHNSSSVFGFLPSIGVGSTFTLTYDGDSTTYRVAATQIYEKENDSLYLNGSKVRMLDVGNGLGVYDLAIMTCYGTSYGNGDASHRFVVYANAI